MSTVNEMIADLLQLQAEGHGNLEVYYRHGASGDCGQLGSIRVTDEVTDEGPFDLEEGEHYVSIYAGN